MKRAALVLASLAMISAFGTAAVAAPEKLRIGTPEAVGFNFYMLDAGIDLGIFRKDDLDIERIDVEGGAKLHQAMAAGAIDIALGGGTDLLFVAKGSPEKAVAVLGTAPANLSILVQGDSPIKTVADLKGKLVGATTKGSLTEWLVTRLSQEQGWGVDGIRMAELGAFDGTLAALKVKQVDAIVGALEAGYLLEDKHIAKVLTGLEGVAPDFITHVVFARPELVKSNPDVVNRFLKGVFASIAFMKANKEKTTEIATKVRQQSPAVMNRTWDYEISMFEDDGHFDPAAVEVIKDSFVDMGILDHKPPNDELFTTQFLPVRP